MAPAPTVHPIGVPTILLVHEDDDFRVSIALKLNRAGCLALQAHDAESALQIAQTHSRRIHLVLIGVPFGEGDLRLFQTYRPHTQVLVGAPNGPISMLNRCTDGVAAQVRQFFAPKQEQANL